MSAGVANRMFAAALALARALALAALVLASAACAVLAAQSKKFNPENYTTAANPTYHALVFGNWDYANIDKIPSAQADYAGMKKFLKDAGYKIWTSEDGQFASEDGFETEFASLLEAVKMNDVVLIYYSGHGFSHRGHNFMVPLDYPDGRIDSFNLLDKAISLEQLVGRIREKGYVFVVTILDSCRDGVPFPLRRGGSDVEGQPMFAPDLGLAIDFDTGRRPARLAVWPNAEGASAAGGQSPDVPSVFTSLLLPALEASSQAEVAKELQAAVDIKLAKQAALKRFLNPKFEGHHQFEFKPDYPDAEYNSWKRAERAWNELLEVPRKSSLARFINDFSWSQFVGMALNLWRDWPSYPEFNQQRETGALFAESAWVKGKNKDVLVGDILTSFPVQAPDRSFSPVTDFDISELSRESNNLVIANKALDFESLVAEAIEKAGSKAAFDLNTLGQYSDYRQPVVPRFDEPLFKGPDTSVPTKRTWLQGRDFNIGETKLDGGDLFVLVEPLPNPFSSVPDFPVPGVGSTGATTEPDWIRFIEDVNSGNRINILGVARTQGFLGENLAGQQRMDTLTAILNEARGGNRAINWISVASLVDTAFDDEIAKLSAELDQEYEDVKRVKILAAIAEQRRMKEENELERQGRLGDTLQVLSALGVDRSRITHIPVIADDNGNDFRIRIFTNR